MQKILKLWALWQPRNMYSNETPSEAQSASKSINQKKNRSR